jgi:hypothetical protein
MSRSARERRAYRLVTIGGVAAAVFAVGIVLSIAGVIGAGIPIIALIVAVVCFILFRGMVRPR